MGYRSEGSAILAWPPLLGFVGLPMAVWFNVSTSAYWRRPPLGIVRVERRLAEELRQALGPKQLRFCVWERDLCTFAPWEGCFPDAAAGPIGSRDQFDPLGSARPAGRLEALRSIGRGVTGLLPARAKPLVEKAGGALESALTAFRIRLRKAVVTASSWHRPAKLCQGPGSHCIELGDLLITVGLDWETGLPAGTCRAQIPNRIPCNRILLRPNSNQISSVHTDRSREGLYGLPPPFSQLLRCHRLRIRKYPEDLREALSTLGLPCPRLIRVRLGTDIPGSAGPAVGGGLRRRGAAFHLVRIHHRATQKPSGALPGDAPIGGAPRPISDSPARFRRVSRMGRLGHARRDQDGSLDPRTRRGTPPCIGQRFAVALPSGALMCFSLAVRGLGHPDRGGTELRQADDLLRPGVNSGGGTGSRGLRGPLGCSRLGAGDRGAMARRNVASEAGRAYSR